MNYISLFSSSGVGCFGFKKEGFSCIATSEILKRRLDVQKANNKTKFQDGYILGDITKSEKKNELYSAVQNYFNRLNNKEKEVDVVIFTAPCQGMSVANHKKNDGTIIKNSLVVEALEIVDHLSPKIFIAENVRSFMNTSCVDHNNNKKIEQAFFDWLSPKYHYESRIINFKDYGANSSRTRTVVIGVRKDTYSSNTISELFPSYQPSKTLREVIGHLPSLNQMGEISKNDIYHNFKAYRPDMRSWIKDLKEGQSAFDNTDKNKRPHRIIDGKIKENVNKNGDKYKRQYWDKIAPCIHTRNDIISSQNTIHPLDDRVFSIRELMLLMNIPNDFKWTANLNNDELNLLNVTEKKDFLKKNEVNIRQSIGEAVPTIIFQKIALNIKKLLERENNGQKTQEDHQQLQFTFS